MAPAGLGSGLAAGVIVATHWVGAWTESSFRFRPPYDGGINGDRPVAIWYNMSRCVCAIVERGRQV
jgi:hypothetical protein